MKKLIILIILLTTSVVYSQNNFYIVGNTGINLEYPKAPYKHVWGTSYNIGIGLGYNFTEELSAEIIYQHNKHSVSTLSIDNRKQHQFINTYFLRANYSFLNSKSIDPFLSFGIGLSDYKFAEEKLNSILSLFPGIGIKHEISGKIGIRLFTEFAFLKMDYISDNGLKYFPIQIAIKYNF